MFDIMTHFLSAIESDVKQSVGDSESKGNQ